MVPFAAEYRADHNLPSAHRHRKGRPLGHGKEVDLTLPPNANTCLLSPVERESFCDFKRYGGRTAFRGAFEIGHVSSFQDRYGRWGIEDAGVRCHLRRRFFVGLHQMALRGRPARPSHRGGPRRRQIGTGVPLMSGSPHIAMAPGGQGTDAKVGISTAVVGPGGSAGIATARAAPGGGAGIARAGAGVGGGAGGGASARGPVILGARTIGPGSGLTVVGGLATAACDVDCPIGEHAPSHSGMALMIATDLTTRHDDPPRLGCCLSTIARSSIPGIGVPWRRFARRLPSACPTGNNSASAATQPTDRAVP
jgi:hypothetical protein